MKHNPGSLAGPNATLNGRVRRNGAAFQAECWAEAEFASHHAVEAAETQTFDSLEEARSWLDRRARQRGFAEILIRH
jgi:hypothetical protein